METKCTFCDPKTITEQEIITIGSVRILYPRRPVIPASALIMPIRCVEDVHDLTSEELTDIFKAVRLLNDAFYSIFKTTSYNLFVNNGAASGQHIPHAHFHFYGRSEGEALNPFTILNDQEKYQNRPQMLREEYVETMQKINLYIQKMMD